MHRLEHRRVGTGGVDVSAGRQSNATAYRGGQVGDDVAEQVVGDDHVEAAGIGDQMDGGGVDVLIGHLDAGILLTHLLHGPRPQRPGERQHVRLVHQRQMLATLLGAREGVFHDTADPECGVGADLGRHFVRGAHADRAAGPGVGAFGALADHHEVDVRVSGKRAAHTGVQPARAQVDVVVELKSQP